MHATLRPGRIVRADFTAPAGLQPLTQACQGLGRAVRTYGVAFTKEEPRLFWTCHRISIDRSHGQVA